MTTDDVRHDAIISQLVSDFYDVYYIEWVGMPSQEKLDLVNYISKRLAELKKFNYLRRNDYSKTHALPYAEAVSIIERELVFRKLQL